MYNNWKIAESFSLRVCTRRHYKIYSTAVLQRVELSSPEKCVERCIENMDYCFVSQFTKKSDEDLGLCTLFNETLDSEIHPDASMDPLSIIYELLEKCPPFTASDITHRITKLHRDTLQDGREAATTSKSRLADAFFPERDHISVDDLHLEDERYAVMRSIEEVEIEAAKNRVEHPRDPFNDGPRYHQSSHERGEFSRHRNHKNQDRRGGEIEEDEDEGDDGGRNVKQPIRPIVVHRGGHAQQMSAHVKVGNPCTPNADCVPTLFQLDNAPCPARQGDPCAPKLPCTNDCYPTAPGGGAQQLPTPEWSEWSQCSASCGLAIKTRQCLGGITCPGLGSVACQVPECAAWTLWTPWSLCSASCGVGEKTRNRICQTGRNCDGPSMEVEACKSLLPCPLWSSWTSWTGCTNSCGKGIERRTRMCQNGLLCPGPATEERPCDKGPCPHWSNWGAWEQCSKPCGGGETYRNRECIDGHSCEGASEEKIMCNLQACPEWSPWTAWTVCDEKCGEDSIRLRNRKCLNAENNNSCEGPAQDQMSCPYRDCPKWEEWGEWSDCSVTCGQGTQKRNRKCDTENDCSGPSDEMRFCQIASCPYWEDWSQWSGCSVTCGKGVCERSRRCITDEFLHLPTLEEVERDDSLEKHEAKEALIARAKTISKYRRTNETRLAPRKEMPLGGTCDGSDKDVKTCDAGPCCSWDKWSEWSSCIGCGKDGIMKRNRRCLADGQPMPTLGFQGDSPSSGGYVTSPNAFNPLLAGLAPIIPVEIHRGKRQALCNCPGESFQTKPCSTPPSCDQPKKSRCEWSEWGDWCGCMRCRGGKETRKRFCDGNDPDCSCGNGRDIEERDCPREAGCLGFSGRQSSREREQHADRHLNRRPTGHPGQEPSGKYGSAALSSPHDRNYNNNPNSPQRPGHSQRGHQDTYVPIDSVIGRVQLGTGSGNSYNKKDSADIFTTTELPFKVCRWSNWSEWSSCQDNTSKERKRFCIGEKDSELISNCECIGPSQEEDSCEINLETDEDIEKSLDKLLQSSETCEWTRWSQWSVCTASCGEGRRMRKRRCPCGDSSCGHGIDSDSEPCEGPPCIEEKKKPIFTVLP
ncbi:unnamed protein product [Caenorhabditis angaria]|uniref:Apple domain-containing protein n=1 Tax=Caenorhabditis angaria TaxID=860376 RepID=A0A9P1NBX5_9PELO|nr:unnamed protein product [Caenorhabditis angaria]